MSEQKADSGAAVPCISLLADQFGTFDSFIGQCDDLAEDIAEKNPFQAAVDGKRMALLVAIAREWHTANTAVCGPKPSAGLGTQDGLVGGIIKGEQNDNG